MTAIKLPNFIKKQPVAVGCALLCVVLALAIYFRKEVLATAQADLDDKTSQANHLKDNVDSANSLANKADKLEDQNTAMAQAIQAIEARLVHVERLPTNKQYFSTIASETQTTLMGLNQSGVATSKKNAVKSAYVGVDYTINVQGTYPQLLDFLRRVENGEHFSQVKNLTLTGSGVSDTPTNKAQILALNLSVELLGLP